MSNLFTAPVTLGGPGWSYLVTESMPYPELLKTMSESTTTTWLHHRYNFSIRFIFYNHYYIQVTIVVVFVYWVACMGGVFIWSE